MCSVLRMASSFLQALLPRMLLFVDKPARHNRARPFFCMVTNDFIDLYLEYNGWVLHPVGRTKVIVCRYMALMQMICFI